MSAPLVNAQAVAEALGLSRQWVYSHALELGGLKCGRVWRFDLEKAKAALMPAPPPAPAPPRPTKRRKRARTSAQPPWLNWRERIR